MTRCEPLSPDLVEVEREHEHLGKLPTVKIIAAAGPITVESIEDASARKSDALVALSGTYEWSLKVHAPGLGIGLFDVRQLFGALNDADIAKYDHNSVAYFVKRTAAHKQVKRLDRVDEFDFIVHRDNLKPLRIFVADEYMLSEAFVLDVLEVHPEVDVIANLSSWNSYTLQAAHRAEELGAKVLDLSGLTAALYRDKEWILAYAPKVGH